MSQQTPWDSNTGAAPPPAPPVPPMPPRYGRYRSRGGMGLGIVLIAIGLLFLVAQLVPGLAWWQMWPLLVVLVGGIMVVTPDSNDGWGLFRVLDGIGTVLIGLVLLGNTTGFISWGVWWTLLTLWPVFLIAFGISVIGRALGQSWVRALSTIVIWAALGYAVATALTGVGGLRPIAPLVIEQQGTAFSYHEPVDSVRTAKLTFDGGAGDIGIASISGGDLISASGRSGFGTPSFTVGRSGGSADVALGLGDQHGFVGPAFLGGRVDVGLSDSVLWDATINAGASNLNADFSHVQLAGLTLKTGVSSSDIELGPLASEAPNPKIVVKAGVSSVTLRIPKDAEARIVTSNGLTSLNVSGDLKVSPNGVWTTPGYSSSRGYDINVESGVGSVSIRTY